ncbi:hypothetical protein BTVI_38778 [Pitangus sulphuratus]|nr:hypothetical protein BTVI_38778 [Pitangus sulphuratus]
MLWKEQGVTVLAISAVYDVFVFHRLKMHQIISALCQGQGKIGPEETQVTLVKSKLPHPNFLNIRPLFLGEEL